MGTSSALGNVNDETTTEAEVKVNFISDTSLAFSAVAWADVPGASVNVDLSNTGKVVGLFSYSCVRSGGTTAVTDIRVVIDTDEGLTFTETFSTFNDTGTIKHFVVAAPAGTYAIKAQMQTTAPITINAYTLAAKSYEDGT